ncbi:MAG: domain protein component of TonB system [Hyphomicrobiales bacterium]|nr:domain protein component of TonB system [Hyphomicrobiales bacterium]
MSTDVAETMSRASVLSGFMTRAKSQDMTLADLIRTAESLNGLGLGADASDLYRTWLAYNFDNSLRHLAWFNYSVTLRQRGDLPGAINALRSALEISPMFGPAQINLGRALEDSGLVAQAIAQWQSFAQATPDITADKVAHKLMTLQHIGRTLENGEQLGAAEDVLKSAIELAPEKTEAAQHWIALRQRQCKWPVLTSSEHMSRRQMLNAISPMALAALSDDPMFQLAKAWRYNQSFVGRPETLHPVRPSARKIGSGQPLRIGYLSSDLREHAVGFALSEVLELHDKKQVEIFAYYCGEARINDPVQTRMRAAVDTWRDVATLTDAQAAALIAEDAIDILIDVNGYTKHARTKVVAHRPAPIIVNFCGYPGTMGSPYHHYIIADAEIIPPENEIFYSEQVLRIPCNQPIDRKRPIAEDRPSRAEAGLPEDAFVYASFNGMQKVTPNCFQRWMTILTQVDGSVLWLLTGNDDTNERLRKAATQAGVDPARLIFAQKAPNPKHLARIGIADLFLDTLPYGAHSTAADAITAGLPIVTLRGRSFAARFCASVVSAAGLADMICDSADDYVERAIAFGRDPELLTPYRERLAANRDRSVLRDIPALVRQLERLFWKMQADGERGMAPTPDLTNLDVYFDIGVELDLENAETLSDADYRRVYCEKLAHWNDFSPLKTDTRLWPGADDTAALAAPQRERRRA